MIFFERRMVIDVLYKHIRQKDKVLTSRRVVGFEQDEHGVAVECQDGVVYHGSILIGADGIHSTVARQMSQLNGSPKKGKYLLFCAYLVAEVVMSILFLKETLGAYGDALGYFTAAQYLPHVSCSVVHIVLFLTPWGAPRGAQVQIEIGFLKYCTLAPG